MSGRTVILSDVHLPAKPSWRKKLEALRGLWQGARRVVFNGDTVNYYHFLKEKMPCDVLPRIEAICREDNVEPVVLAGNSDLGFAHQRHLFLADKRVVVFHGEVLFDQISPWRTAARRLQSHRLAILDAMPLEQRDTLEGQLLSAEQAIKQVRKEDRLKRERPGSNLALRRLSFWWLWHPLQALAVLRAWRDMPELAAAFVKRFVPQSQCAVVGHVHRGGHWHIGGKDIVNTGSFEGPFGPMVAEVTGDELLVRRVNLSKTLCTPGRLVKSITLH